MNDSYQVKVKICGLTDVNTALAAVEAGADALGFVFAPSRRRVHPKTAREIIAQLPPLVARVGVFVNSPVAEVEDIAGYCGLTVVQLSGDEPPDYTLNISLPVIRTIRVGYGKTAADLNNFVADAFLFDTYCEKNYGGTGKTFDWSLLENVRCPKPMLLAGGLNPLNISEAVRKVKPYAVDVSGGVETDGQKDVQKIKQFISLAKGVL